MAPETPGNLLLLNMRYDPANKLMATVEAVEPMKKPLPPKFLHVRFDEAPGEDFLPIGRGVAHVKMAEGYDHTPAKEESKIPDLPGVRQYKFSNVAQGDGLQLIMILPVGYSLNNFNPVPTSAKEFEGRVAVYFRPPEKFGDTATVTWGLKKFRGNAQTEAKRLRGEIVQNGHASRNPGVYLDREDPEFKEPKHATKAGLASNHGAGQPLSAKAYVLISLAGLICATGFTLFYIYFVPRLVESGTQNQIFYLLLIPWGLSSAVFLFGVMRSYARFTYRHLGSVLELGGPAVFFCLVVVGGFKLVPASHETFDLTVRAHSEDGRDPIITSGKITIDLDTDRRIEAIGPNGEADFKGIPPRFRGGTVKILPQVKGYEEKWQRHKLQGNVLELPLVRAQPLSLTGSIVPPPGKDEDIKILVDGQKAETSPDQFGRFELSVDGKTGDRVRLKVFDRGKLVYDDFQVLPGPVTIKLHMQSGVERPVH